MRSPDISLDDAPLGGVAPVVLFTPLFESIFPMIVSLQG
jgi:hypothetical protein